MLVRDIVNAYQTEYIMELAAKGPCVIVGRSADYVLEGRENGLNVFIYGNLADRFYFCCIYQTKDDVVKRSCRIA